MAAAFPDQPLEIERHGQDVTVHLGEQRVLDESAVQGVRDSLLGLAADQIGGVLTLSLQGVEYLGSAMLETLINMYRKVKATAAIWSCAIFSLKSTKCSKSPSCTSYSRFTRNNDERGMMNDERKEAREGRSSFLIHRSCVIWGAGWWRNIGISPGLRRPDSAQLSASPVT